jgi:hypothetical protein
MHGHCARQIAPNLIKHVKPASLKASVAAVMGNNNWVRMIMGTPLVHAIVKYLELCEGMHKMIVTDGVPDSVS